MTLHVINYARGGNTWLTILSYLMIRTQTRILHQINPYKIQKNKRKYVRPWQFTVSILTHRVKKYLSGMHWRLWNQYHWLLCNGMSLSVTHLTSANSFISFANQTEGFHEAYLMGLNGRQAVWAAHKYRGHQIIPEAIFNELEREGIF